MNNQFIISALASFLITSTFAEQTADKERTRLLGPVQSISSITTVADRESERLVVHYNTQGNEVETLRYVATGSLAEKSVHTDNTSSKRTETMTYNPAGSLLTKTLYLYDFQGRLSERTTLDDVGLIERTTYLHQPEKNTIEETTTYARQSPPVRRTHFHDSEGRKTATLTFARDGSVSKTIPAYDDKGNETDRTVYAGDGAVLDHLRYEYEFDDVGNWVKQTEFICLPTAEPEASVCTPAAIVSRTIAYIAQRETP